MKNNMLMISSNFQSPGLYILGELFKKDCDVKYSIFEGIERVLLSRPYSPIVINPISKGEEEKAIDVGKYCKEKDIKGQLIFLPDYSLEENYATEKILPIFDAVISRKEELKHIYTILGQALVRKHAHKKRAFYVVTEEIKGKTQQKKRLEEEIGEESNIDVYNESELPILFANLSKYDEGYIIPDEKIEREINKIDEMNKKKISVTRIDLTPKVIRSLIKKNFIDQNSFYQSTL